jgi:phosphohistidine phosphatase
MKVILVRHAIAHERNRTRWPDDSLRPLTPEGVRKFRQAARGLATLLPKSAVIMTSPWVRARDTAIMLASALKGARPIERTELTGNAALYEAFDLLRSRKETTVVLVGHEPNLGRLLATALAGDSARVEIEFKKGGAACVAFGKRPTPGSATLVWMLPPRVLRALG